MMTHNRADLPNKKISASIEINVPFFDVDSVGITWHGNYIKYFEMARCALLEKIEYDYVAMQASGYAFPIVDIRVKYIKPTKFKQKIIVNAMLAEYENRLKIEYVIMDKQTKETLTKAHSVQVAIDMNTHEMCFSSPSILLKKVGAFV